MPQILVCGIASPLLCPDVGAEGFVLLLRFESGYIIRVIGLDTCRSRSRNGFELRLMCQLCLSVRILLEVALVAAFYGVLGVPRFAKEMSECSQTLPDIDFTKSIGLIFAIVL